MAETVVEVDPLSRNKELADLFSLIGNYYTMARDTYRARTFNNASAKIAAHPFAILSGAQARHELGTGIGDSIQAAIDEYIATGTNKRLQELQAQFPDRKQVIDYFLTFFGIGPVTAVRFYDQGLRTLEDLWNKGNLNDAQKLGVLWRDHIGVPIPRDEMNVIKEAIGRILDPYQIRWEIAGSYRRGELSSNDIDLLVESRPDLNMVGLVSLLSPILPATFSLGETKMMGMLRLSEDYFGHRIDVRIIESQSYPFALMYFTGSQRFNILMRQRAIDLGMTLNEYGLYKDGVPIQVITEDDIFRVLRVQVLTPEQRTRTLNTLPLL